MKDNQNDKLISENRLLKDKLKEVTKEDTSITDITDILSDSDEDDSLEEMMDINIPQLRKVLLTRLKDKQTEHIENLINSYNLRKMNKVKKVCFRKDAGGSNSSLIRFNRVAELCPPQNISNDSQS